MGDNETRRGAMNRAKAAYEAACCSLSNDNSINNTQPDFSVGLEGGLDGGFEADDLWCMAWMAIYGSQSAVCTAAKERTMRLHHPKSNKCSWDMLKLPPFFSLLRYAN